MREHPILFNTENVKAILDGRKTQTRRVIKPQPPNDALIKEHIGVAGYWIPYTADVRLMNSAQGSRKDDCGWYCPYGQVGDKLWVRETWATEKRLDFYRPSEMRNAATIALWYMTNDTQFDRPEQEMGKIRPSIFMPRWASRITLEITGVRVERVQEISNKDANAEGFPWHGIGATLQFGYRQPLTWFSDLWNSLNAKRGYGWDTNCWVWVIEFKKVDNAQI